jgi:hypothetical protein
MSLINQYNNILSSIDISRNIIKFMDHGYDKTPVVRSQYPLKLPFGVGYLHIGYSISGDIFE